RFSTLKIWIPCFFFFQAEDGIRDLTVTGVQTCALPIWPDRHAKPRRLPQHHAGGYGHGSERRHGDRRQAYPILGNIAPPPDLRRSEERRVGKECRSRGAPRHDKKKRT